MITLGFDLPNLNSGNHTVTSPADPRYNCVSHSVWEDLIPYWPDEDNYWPASVARQETIDAFVEFFVSAGFSEIDMTETSVVQGFDKIALYADGDLPRHVARQLSSGRWTSKFGVLVDVEHANLGCLEQGQFGRVVKLMMRQKTGTPPIILNIQPPRPSIIRP